jgi:hypothetical protein
MSATRRTFFSVVIAAITVVGCGGEAEERETGGGDAPGPTPSSTEVAIDPTNRLLSGLEAARDQVSDPANQARVAEALAELDAATGVEWTPEMLAVLGASYCNDWERPVGEEGLTLTDSGREDWAAAVGPLLSLTAEQADAAVRSDAGVDFRVCQ